MAQDILKQIYDLALMPILTISRPDSIRQVARILTEEDHPVIEITLRTEAAFEALSILRTEYPDFLVGAGTVLSTDLVRRAVDAGARFIVAPGFNPKVVDYCLNHRIPVIPGVSGASEIEFALERNIKVLKFFPAETGGGVAFLKALSAPFPDVNFIATGGVSLSNLKSYLEYDRIWACGGSFMATREQLDSGQWDAVRNSVRTAIKIMLGFSIEGITAEDKNMQAVFPALFVTPENTQDKTVFIKTMNLTRTTAYLKRKGIPFTEAGERLILKQEVNGQAVVIARQG